MDNLIYLLVVIFSVIGFAVALKIFKEKKSNKAMVCPFNGRCERVLFSKYSKFLGIQMEIWGMFYYAISIIGYGALLLWPEFRTAQIISLLFFMISSGFIFSLYLTSVQVIRLKELCSWCLGSALISVINFLLILNTGGLIAVSNITREYLISSAIVYSGFLLFGFIAVLIYEFLSIYFAINRRISHEESRVLHLLSEIILLMLGGVTIFNYVFYTSDSINLLNSPQFISKIVILALLIIAHLAFHIYSSIQRYLGPFSLLSWGFILVLEMRGADNISVLQDISVYFVLVILAVAIASKLRG